MSAVKYPNIHVKLVGNDGNAHAILGAVGDALRQNGVDAETVAEFSAEATSGDYDHLLCTCMDWVNVS